MNVSSSYEGDYPSFECRRDDPTRYQSVINPVPLVDAPEVSVFFVCVVAIIALGVFFGLVPWFVPERLEGGL